MLDAPIVRQCACRLADAHRSGVRGRALVDLNARHGEDLIREDRSGSKKPRQRTSLYGRRGDRRPM